MAFFSFFGAKSCVNFLNHCSGSQWFINDSSGFGYYLFHQYISDHSFIINFERILSHLENKITIGNEINLNFPNIINMQKRKGFYSGDVYVFIVFTIDDIPIYQSVSVNSRKPLRST